MSLAKGHFHDFHRESDTAIYRHSKKLCKHGKDKNHRIIGYKFKIILIIRHLIMNTEQNACGYQEKNRADQIKIRRML